MSLPKKSSKRKKDDKMKKLEKVLRQFPHGIRIAVLAGKVGISRSYAYDLLQSLELQGKAYYEDGIAYPERKTQKKEEVAPSILEIKRKIDAELKQCAERHITLVGLEWLANQVGECPERIKEFAYRIAKKYGITISREFSSYIQFNE